MFVALVFLLCAYHIPCLVINFFLMEQLSSVCLCDLADYAAGISCCNGPGGDIFGNDAPGTDDCIISDMYAGAHYRVSSQPYIVTDGHFFAIFKSGIASIRVNRMSCRIDGYVGRHLAVIAYFYFGHIDNRTVIIGKEIFTYLDVGTVVTIKRWINKRIFRFSQKFFYDFC